MPAPEMTIRSVSHGVELWVEDGTPQGRVKADTSIPFSSIEEIAEWVHSQTQADVFQLRLDLQAYPTPRIYAVCIGEDGLAFAREDLVSHLTPDELNSIVSAIWQELLDMGMTGREQVALVIYLTHLRRAKIDNYLAISLADEIRWAIMGAAERSEPITIENTFIKMIIAGAIQPTYRLQQQRRS